METANQVAAYISKLDQQPIRDHYLFLEILIYIRCKHKIYLDLKGITRLALKPNTTITLSLKKRKSMPIDATRHFESLDLVTYYPSLLASANRYSPLAQNTPTVSSSFILNRTRFTAMGNIDCQITVVMPAVVFA